MSNSEAMNLQRANKILFNPKYNELLNVLETNEEFRIYCKHNIEHFLDVARIMMILNFQSNNIYEADIIYATALLHDIGRAISNERHDEESVKISKELLNECGYDADEIELITKAIGEHRKDESKTQLSGFLYFADKKSRLCFSCKASENCKWSNEKKTNELIF